MPHSTDLGKEHYYSLTFAPDADDGGNARALKLFRTITTSNCTPAHIPARPMNSHRGKPFRFVALLGELRNAVYARVIAALAPPNPDRGPVDLCACTAISKGTVRTLLLSSTAGPAVFSSTTTPFDLPPPPTPETHPARHLVRSCRLGEASRAIRREFTPLLWRAQTFKLCACGPAAAGTGIIDDDKSTTAAIPLALLRGNVQKFVVDMHAGHGARQDDPARELRYVVAALRALRFAGVIELRGRRGVVLEMRTALEGLAGRGGGGGACGTAGEGADEDMLERVVAAYEAAVRAYVADWAARGVWLFAMVMSGPLVAAERMELPWRRAVERFALDFCGEKGEAEAAA